MGKCVVTAGTVGGELDILGRLSETESRVPVNALLLADEVIVVCSVTKVHSGSFTLSMLLEDKTGNRLHEEGLAAGSGSAFGQTSMRIKREDADTAEVQMGATIVHGVASVLAFGLYGARALYSVVGIK